MKRLKKLQKHPESKKQELTVEKIIFETRVAGAGFYEALDFTWGEAIEFIKIYNERRKREMTAGKSVSRGNHQFH